MYLKSLRISNFRKFGTNNNKIEFVNNFKEENNDKAVNIASKTTLIVGKNNSGKTTVTKALNKLINSNKFEAGDFNISYLKGILDLFKKKKDKVTTPSLAFEVIVGIRSKSTDLICNIIPFMNISNTKNSELKISIKYELKEDSSFIAKVNNLIAKNPISDNIMFEKFLEIINESDFILNYYDTNKKQVKNFKIKDLIELEPIEANKISNDIALSNAFSKIIEYRYHSILNDKERCELEDKIENINMDITKTIDNSHTKGINKAIGMIHSKDKLEVLLSSNLTFKKLMNNLIKYQYVEDSNNIPENQFGLGYTNLMTIIAKLIDYIERYPNKSLNSKINLISIEEPETFMHPQMQELFIKHINEAISAILENKDKNINSQLIITTHSSHILNSKIHNGNSFDNISYITTIDKHSNIVNLNEEKIKPDSNDQKDKEDKDLKFLKKHIKYKVSELFFSDAVIFVEGVTEDTLLHYYLEKNINLNKHYISIFNINGAHGLVYHNLIKLLKIPCIIITDLDIKRSKKEKGEEKNSNDETEFIQIKNIDNRQTTNATIIKYNNDSNTLKSLPANSKFEEKNIFITFQNKIKGYYATSFEEAFILTNHNNKLLNKVLKLLKPQIYKKIVGNNIDLNQIKENSYQLQRKLSKSKSEFANELLYELINTEETKDIPILPEYITNSLNWLETKLNGGKE